MDQHLHFMRRALDLATKGAGYVAPNPMVGCVIVHNGTLIGEGYHRAYGGPHAEVHAIQSISDPSLLEQSTLYVSLEPCAHHGKTPPCSDLIIAKGIPKVVVACTDPFAAVNGKGIEKLQSAGVDVSIGILQKEAEFLNRRFFLFHQKKRPYVILKWAQTQDGFIDRKRSKEENGQQRISGDQSRMLVHRWRTEESAILVGKNTVLTDDPQLTARYYQGKQPLRIVFDKHLELPLSKKIFSSEAETLILNESRNEDVQHLKYRTIDWENPVASLMELLYSMNILSVIVEGGSQTLEHFIRENIWDEARIFHSPIFFHEGYPAPVFAFPAKEEVLSGNDQLSIHFNPEPA